jgi:hexosaminidase
MKQILLILTIFSSVLVSSQNNRTTIIPTPKNVLIQKSYINLSEITSIQTTGVDKNNIQFINNLLMESLPEQRSGSSIIKIDAENKALKNDEYKIEINKKQIEVKASNYKMAFYAVQSLIQLFDLAEYNKVHCQTIEDQIGFDWRGLHIDVARTYYPLAQLKKIVKMMAYYKLNVLHLHLTDDQAWRMEVKSLPQLAEVGSYGGPYSVIGGKWLGNGNGQGHGMFYKHKHIKRLIKYASQFQIEIVPEIDVPAHAAALLAAFPEIRCTSKDSLPSPHKGVFGLDYNHRNKKSGKKLLQWDANREVCVGNEKTFEILEKVFDEVISLFPSDYVHIGGDEAYKHGWAHCERCKKRMQEEKLSDVKKLQSYFVKRLEKYLISKNKKMIGWNEILQGGVNKTTTVMFWNGHGHDKEIINNCLEDGNEMIMTPINNVYFDITYERRSEKDVYQFNPLKFVKPEHVEKVKGIQACVWGEHGRLDSDGQVRYDAMENFERMIFPRLLSLSELAWHKGKGMEDKAFFDLLDKHVQILKKKKNISIGEVKMVPWW